MGLTGYNRWYAVGLLGGDGGRRGASPRRPRQRRRVYDAAVLTALRQAWVIMDCIRGKRLLQNVT